MTWHVHPVEDARPHDLESSACECDPAVRILENGDMLIVHNSFDGREGMEIVNQILSPQ